MGAITPVKLVEMTEEGGAIVHSALIWERCGEPQSLVILMSNESINLRVEFRSVITEMLQAAGKIMDMTPGKTSNKILGIQTERFTLSVRGLDHFQELSYDRHTGRKELVRLLGIILENSLARIGNRARFAEELATMVEHLAHRFMHKVRRVHIGGRELLNKPPHCALEDVSFEDVFGSLGQMLQTSNAA